MQTFLKIFGYTLPEIVGKPHEILLPERQRNPDEAEVGKTFPKGNALQVISNESEKTKQNFGFAPAIHLVDDTGRVPDSKVAMVVGREIEKILEDPQSGLRHELSDAKSKEALERLLPSEYRYRRTHHLCEAKIFQQFL